MRHSATAIVALAAILVASGAWAKGKEGKDPNNVSGRAPPHGRSTEGGTTGVWGRNQVVPGYTTTEDFHNHKQNRSKDHFVGADEHPYTEPDPKAQRALHPEGLNTF